jgi:hypothetical protein
VNLTVEAHLSPCSGAELVRALALAQVIGDYFSTTRGQAFWSAAGAAFAVSSSF